MDLYRYFHPHYNPHLLKTPLRLQELSELRQAAKELKKALGRAELRGSDKQSQYLAQSSEALSFVIEVISSLVESHPGDSEETMSKLLEERRKAPGWEHWASLLEERLKIVSRLGEPAQVNRSS